MFPFTTTFGWVCAAQLPVHVAMPPRSQTAPFISTVLFSKVSVPVRAPVAREFCEMNAVRQFGSSVERKLLV
jgi:hypothetical protein